MNAWRREIGIAARLAAFVLAPAAFVAACTTSPPLIEAPPPMPDMPSSIRAEEVVGRWGYGSFHNDADRARTETAARGQCGQPVTINRGPGGGVLMYLADSAQLQEVFFKGAPGGRNFVGPPGPAGGPQDREVLSFDGRTMVLRWTTPDVQTRYGTGVYVRCGAEGARRPATAAH
jgi:hypothetical protein